MEIFDKRNFKTYTSLEFFSVKAKPMTKDEAIKTGVIQDPSLYQRYKDGTDGYCVYYNNGLTSWESKEEFESYYNAGNTRFDRICTEEYKELNKRISNLYKFISSEEFYKLDSYDQKLLQDQGKVMTKYSKILNVRINRMKRERYKQ